MKEIIVAAWDDVDLAGVQEARTPADHTVLLSVRIVSGDETVELEKTVELDLTGEHAQQVEEDLVPWLDIGHEPSHTGARQTERRQHSSPRNRKKQVTAPVDRVLDELGFAKMSPERLTWLRRFRDWAEQQGRTEYRFRDGKEAGFYYPRPLVSDYLEHLAQGGDTEAGRITSLLGWREAS